MHLKKSKKQTRTEIIRITENNMVIDLFNNYPDLDQYQGNQTDCSQPGYTH